MNLAGKADDGIAANAHAFTLNTMTGRPTKLSHSFQWLSDNGSSYREHETIEFAIRLGLLPCFTPVRSPQSKSMAESFIKTFKRDYMCVHDPPKAKTVLSHLSAWFENYTRSILIKPCG